ncbi:hypothetical protein [Rhizobium rhizogenes]|uniref:hypothetical protein n=1 Tax=Rhizobium rhizogenes TaxID=359 RepID=UPI001572D7B0|nr:hypothetical protein [Rhizobium rhizogenes]NTF89695.1 hypothetical protein [Rhizobium rhizogenes]NTI31541.1 hypothetical protein [Rhizobium rhizogenes]
MHDKARSKIKPASDMGKTKSMRQDSDAYVRPTLFVNEQHVIIRRFGHVIEISDTLCQSLPSLGQYLLIGALPNGYLEANIHRVATPPAGGGRPEPSGRKAPGATPAFFKFPLNIRYICQIKAQNRSVHMSPLKHGGGIISTVNAIGVSLLPVSLRWLFPLEV